MRARLHEAPSNYYAAGWNALGRIDVNQGDMQAAKTSFSRALAMYREVFKGGNYRIGISLSNLGRACFELKEYPQAEPYLRESIRILAVLLPTDSRTATAKVRLARVLAAERRYSEAEPLYREAYASLSQGKDAGTDDTEKIHEELAALQRQMQRGAQN